MKVIECVVMGDTGGGDRELCEDCKLRIFDTKAVTDALHYFGIFINNALGVNNSSDEVLMDNRATTRFFLWVIK